ncbi:hypothetical protein [Nitrosococcus wardiae]|uniref:Recombinase RecT n=1 Tax=Nitrosococcus wardiae TaxID=1814290 RepID=A0A4P7BZZ0_9GAMM|nr:hypothetical protein [Nitrosococcus wardiae]QBQ54927.1 hypothetical protein E3U44_10670 [Nitrosococcus wardiae]
MSEQNLAVKEETPMSAFGSIQAFESVQRMATMLAKSDMVPKQYQDNLPNCVIALEMANRMGASVFAVMQNLAIVHGKPSWEAKFIIGAINSCGRFSPLRFDLSEEGSEEEVEGFYYQWDPSTKKNKKVPVINSSDSFYTLLL